jgi:hypothetical protein
MGRAPISRNGLDLSSKRKTASSVENTRQKKKIHTGKKKPLFGEQGMPVHYKVQYST